MNKVSSTSANPNCPCPYDVAFGGSIFGRRAAYAKLRESEPACYQGETSARQLWWNSAETRFVERNRKGQ
ncbi:hypothetical protein [Coleofasciculus sp. FACHB-SPT9]|uniref:hypothetical protein n=1 Tax=Coleofasciculus sp. FACHB-SPT9 TaxID=2692791 RepID=UPI001684FD70|nr:hypothetical protein [Coleofasciculus sp. FACHB-SPT9]MBD1892945.1 hypothetical protein [Coleofasciculus sp. FACHB-SPT9]